MDVHQFFFTDYVVFIGLMLFLSLAAFYFCMKHALALDQLPLLTQVADWLESSPHNQQQLANLSKDRKYAKLREFLTGASKHDVLPATLSLFACYISPMTLLGVPATTYYRGAQPLVIIFPLAVSIWLATKLFVPVFHPLQLKSTAEYLELRFDERIRVAAFVILVLNTLLRMGMWLLTPSLMLAKLTNIPYGYSMFFTIAIMTFYTSMGGMATIRKAELIQLFIMSISLISLLIKAASIVGGFDSVWLSNAEFDRLYIDDFDPNPFTNKITFWTVMGSNIIQWGSVYCTQQPVLTRYMPAANVQIVNRILWLQVPLMSILYILSGFVGLTMFTFYYRCDPFLAGRVQRIEEMSTVFCSDIGQSVPGLMGLFVTGVFSGSLSSLSSNLNSLTTQFFEDILKRYFGHRMDQHIHYQTFFIRLMAVVYGICTVSMIWLAKMVKNTIHFRLLLNNMFAAPLFAVYLLGILNPNCTPTAALTALIVGVLSGFALCLNYHYNYIGVTPIGTSVDDCIEYFCRRWPAVSGCSVNVSLINEIAVNETVQKLKLYPKSWSFDWNFRFMQHFSYHIGGIFTLVVTLVVGFLVSWHTKDKRNRSEIDPYLCLFLQKNKQNIASFIQSDPSNSSDQLTDELKLEEIKLEPKLPKGFK